MSILRDIVIREVSLVGKAANKKRFCLYKSADAVAKADMGEMYDALAAVRASCEALAMLLGGTVPEMGSPDSGADGEKAGIAMGAMADWLDDVAKACGNALRTRAGKVKKDDTENCDHQEDAVEKNAAAAPVAEDLAAKVREQAAKIAEMEAAAKARAEADAKAAEAAAKAKADAEAAAKVASEADARALLDQLKAGNTKREELLARIKAAEEEGGRAVRHNRRMSEQERLEYERETPDPHEDADLPARVGARGDDDDDD
jgi:hypothetical protein